MNWLNRLCLLWAAVAGLLAGEAASAAEPAPKAPATAPAPVTLRYAMWDANQRPLYQQCADDFQKANPGIRIRIQQQGWEDYWTTLSTGLVAETAPDVFVNHLAKYPDLVANGQLVDLAPFMRRDGVDLARFEPGLALPWGRDGRQYGLPKDWDTVALLVNLDHARAQGVTLDELRNMHWNPKDGGSFGQVVARLTRDAAGRNALQPGFDKTRVQVVGYQNPGAGGMSGQTEWSAFAASAGFSYQSAPWDAALRYDDPVLAATITWLAKLPGRGLSLPPQAVGKLGVETLFATGRAAMVPDGAWMLGHYARKLRMAYAWVPMPVGPSGQRASMRNGLADSIWIGTRHPDAAWAWVRHLAGADCQRRLAQAGVNFPALAGLSAQTLAVFRQRGVDAGAFAEMATGRIFAPPIVENAAEIDQLVGQAIERVLLGRAEAGPALAAANAKARALARR
jgi:multiple sugar transport system substrate-binding protein